MSTHTDRIIFVEMTRNWLKSQALQTFNGIEEGWLDLEHPMADDSGRFPTLHNLPISFEREFFPDDIEFIGYYNGEEVARLCMSEQHDTDRSDITAWMVARASMKELQTGYASSDVVSQHPSFN